MKWLAITASLCPRKANSPPVARKAPRRGTCLLQRFLSHFTLPWDRPKIKFVAYAPRTVAIQPPAMPQLLKTTDQRRTPKHMLVGVFWSFFTVCIILFDAPP
jgi:hypothetical protein